MQGGCTGGMKNAPDLHHVGRAGDPGSRRRGLSHQSHALIAVYAMEALKRELQQVLRSTEHPDMLLGIISGMAAWAITTVLQLLFGS